MTQLTRKECIELRRLIEGLFMITFNYFHWKCDQFHHNHILLMQ
jgi:hypothetical protein